MKVSKILLNVLYGKVAILWPYAVKKPKPHSISNYSIAYSWSQPSITHQWMLRHLQRSQKLFAKHCYQYCLFLKRNPDWFSIGISLDSIKNEPQHCEQEPSAKEHHVQRRPVCTPDQTPSEGDALPEERTMSWRASDEPLCCLTWEKHPLGTDPHAHMYQDMGELTASHTAGRAVPHFSPREQGLAPEFSRRSQELGSVGELLPIKPCRNIISSQATRSRHIQGSPPSNMALTVTFLGQHCTAPKSLTFLVGMTAPSVSLFLQQHEYSRHPHHSSWLSDRCTDGKCPKTPAAFCRGQIEAENLRVFIMLAEVKLWKQKAKLLVPCLVWASLLQPKLPQSLLQWQMATSMAGAWHF